MYSLNIETSGKNCSVGIFKDKKLCCLCEEIEEDFRHSEKLHVFIQWALEGADLSLKDIDVIAVGQGPGSYTGLRIGLAAAKGLAYGLQVPLITHDSLEILLQPYRDKNYDYLIPMFDARRNDVYMAVYDKNGNHFSESRITTLQADTFADKNAGSKLFIGNGAKKAREILRTPNAKYLSKRQPSARHMGALTYDKYLQKNYADLAYTEPKYL